MNYEYKTKALFLKKYDTEYFRKSEFEANSL